jgi:protein TonB
VDVPPVLTSRRLPAYTKRAVRKGQEGRVEMNLLIDEQGRVADLRLERTIPDSELNETAIYAVRHWRFEPARKDGVPVRVWKPVIFEFSLRAGRGRERLVE